MYASAAVEKCDEVVGRRSACATSVRNRQWPRSPGQAERAPVVETWRCRPFKIDHVLRLPNQRYSRIGVHGYLSLREQRRDSCCRLLSLKEDSCCTVGARVHWLSQLLREARLLPFEPFVVAALGSALVGAARRRRCSRAEAWVTLLRLCFRRALYRIALLRRFWLFPYSVC